MSKARTLRTLARIHAELARIDAQGLDNAIVLIEIALKAIKEAHAIMAAQDPPMFKHLPKP